jgi:hypothetical protein
MHTKLFLEDMKGRDHIGHLLADRMTVVKWVSEKHRLISRCQMDLFDSVRRQIASFSGHSNELSGSI